MRAMPPATAVSEHRDEPHSVGFTLVSIALGISMAGLALAYSVTAIGAHWLDRLGAPGTSATVSRTLVDRQLHIPSDWLVDPAATSGTFASRIELRILAPLARNGGETPIDITLQPLSQVRSSASLLDGVYLHQFMPNELSGPPGLVGKPLYSTEGYENETVWYDALSPEPFVAKCATAPVEGKPSQCLRTVALPGGIAAVYAFDAGVLYSWRDFDRVMDEMLRQIGAIDTGAAH
jgi:hypothetical protein